jgi:F-type H+-transporting ATPase subunit O
LTQILASPTLQPEDKKLVVSEVLKAAGAAKEENVKNLLEVLAENNRLALVQGIIEKYEVLMSAYRGEVEAVITSAQVSGLYGEWRSRALLIHMGIDFGF